MEELSSKLGFDAAQALATLRELDGVLAKFEKTVGGTGKGLDLFNKRAGKTVGALKQIKSGADRAFASLDRLARARAVAMSGSTADTSGVSSSVRSEADAVLEHLANVKAKFGEIPAIARTDHKRAFESAATKVAEYAKRSGKSMDDVRRIQNNLGQSFTGAENKIADGLARVEKSYGKLGETGTRSTKALTISWETMARVVATQAIVRALSMVRNALGDAYNDSIDFQRQIAEIRTISPIKNLNQLAATVRGLSDQFNQPLGDVSEGYYQVISNQIQGTANQVDVLSTAMKFSKVAVASTEDSVNLLTGTLNAFGMDASRSEDVAAKFFKTIELGRTRASELAVSFGRTAPMAAQLGVSLEELQASYAAVTIGGVKTAEAATQIRGAMTGMVKPTTAMKEAFQKLGYASAEQAIAALGFVGTMNAVISTTDGSTTSIAKLFPRVRGLNAVLRLTSTGADAYNKSLAELGRTDLTELNNQFTAIMDTDVERVTKELNELKNMLTTGLGTSLVKTTRLFFDTTGGAEGLYQVSRALVPVIGAGAVALVGFGGKAAWAAVQTRTLATQASLASKAIGGLSLGVALGLGAKTVGNWIGDWIVDQRGQADEAFGGLVADYMKKFRETEAERVKTVEGSFKNIQAAIQKEVTAKKTAYDASIATAAKANEKLVQNTKSTADAIIRIQEDRIRRFQQMEDDALAAIDQSQRRSVSARDQLSDDAFERNNRRLVDTSQLDRYAKRSQQIAEYAAKMLAGATSDDQISDALAQFDRASGFAKQADAIANRTKNRQLEAKAAEAVRGVLQKQLVAETRLQQTQQRRAQESERLANQEKRNLERLKTLSARMQGSASLFDDDGKQLPANQRRKQVQEYQAAFREFQKIALSSESLDVGRVIDLANLGKNLNRQLDSVEINTLRAAPEALESLNDQIRRATDDLLLNLKFSFNLPKYTELGRDFEKIGEAVDDVIGKYNRLIQQQSAAQQVQTELGYNFARMKANVSGLGVGPVGASEEEFLAFLGDRTKDQALSDMQRGIASLTREMVTLSGSSELTKDAFEGVAQRAQAFVANLGKLDMASAEMAAFSRNFDIFKKSYELRDSLIDNPFSGGDGERQLRELEQFIQRMREETQRSSTSSSNLQSNLLNTITPARLLAESSLAAADAMERMVRASGQITTPSIPSIPTIPTLTSAKGGLVRKLAGGGFIPQGTDTVPAMLSPGEFVVNARSSRKFFSQLVAINAGVRPVYRQEGGPVTNVGDIHVNVNGNESARQSARTIAAGVRRELRRGTSIL